MNMEMWNQVAQFYHCTCINLHSTAICRLLLEAEIDRKIEHLPSGFNQEK